MQGLCSFVVFTQYFDINQKNFVQSESFFIGYDEADKQNKALTISHIVGKVWSQPWEIVEFKDQQWINEALPIQLNLLSDGSHTKKYLNSETMIDRRMESMRKEQSFLDINLKEFSKRSLDDDWIFVAQSKGIVIRSLSACQYGWRSIYFLVGLYVLTLLEDILTKPVYQTGLQRFFKYFFSHQVPMENIFNLKTIQSLPDRMERQIS